MGRGDRLVAVRKETEQHWSKRRGAHGLERTPVRELTAPRDQPDVDWEAN